MGILNAESARIFRLTHISNLPWILDHGIHCKGSGVLDPNFVSIGMEDLIRKRVGHAVPAGPQGALSDYVPFYFTPWSIMMYNIKTGYNGVTPRKNGEIVVLISSLHKLTELALPFVFTNGHALLRDTDYYRDLRDLDKIDWKLLNGRNFMRDPEDPGKVGRYQAEALVHRHVPLDALLGIACYDDAACLQIEVEVQSRKLSIPVKSLPAWYF